MNRGSVLAEYGFALGGLAMVFVAATDPLVDIAKEMVTSSETRMAIQASSSIQSRAKADEMTPPEAIPEKGDGPSTSFRFNTPAGNLLVLDGEDEDVVALIEIEGAEKIKFDSKPDGFKGTDLKLKKGDGIDLELVCKKRSKCLGTTFFTVEATSKDTDETISRSFAITLENPLFQFVTPAGDLVVLDDNDDDIVAMIEIEGAEKIKFDSKPDGFDGTYLELKEGDGIDLELVCKKWSKCLGTTFFTVEATSKDTDETISRSFAVSLSGEDHDDDDDEHDDDDD